MKPASHDCCHASPPPSCHGEGASRARPDLLLWGSLLAVAVGYVYYLAGGGIDVPYLGHYAHATYEIMNSMWWGLALGMLAVGLMARVPREMVMAVIGLPGTTGGVARATLAGVMLDTCSHGVLLIGMKLYERGAGLGQVMAFLIASPWNSLSLTLVLAALIGWGWALLFILASAAIALLSGVLFNRLVAAGVLPDNPNRSTLPEGYALRAEIRGALGATRWTPALAALILRDAWRDSQMILRWIFFGVLLAALIRTFVPPDMFGTFFGPTLAGLGLTLLVATVLEVCSEGSAPIAADIHLRAGAPGNGFTFLMAGVSTDYTEILSLKETTRSWKIALFLPLITLPQVLALAVVMNLASP